MSDPLSILKGEIKRLGFVSNEKISYLATSPEMKRNRLTRYLSLMTVILMKKGINI
jgi:hypothetical protein